jgi:hypothetical protein
MAERDVGSDNAPVEHIGPKRSTNRNLFLITTGLLLVGVLVLFYWYRGAAETGAMAELDHFREAMYNQCKDPQFKEPVDRRFIEIYAENEKMRAVVVEQFHELQRGRVTCPQVVQALRSVDYPVR